MSELFDVATNLKYTENGALSYKSTLDKCLDLFSLGGSYRERSEEDIHTLVEDAYKENPELCLQILLYIRHCRGGLGEKKVPIEGLKYLTSKYSEDFNKDNLFLVLSELGSWNDVFGHFSVEEYANLVKNLAEKSGGIDKMPALVYKWLPSIGGGKNKDAEKLAKSLGLTPKQYRKMLTEGRKSLNLTETKMCSNLWGEIEYDKIPSRTGYLNKNAFMKHDNERYTQFHKDVASGEKKVNAGQLFPNEIVKQVMEKRYPSPSKEVVQMYDNYWNNIKDYPCDGNSVVVADVSGSMSSPNNIPMSISVALALYFAERNKGKFGGEFITFSSNPTFHRIKGNNIFEKVINAMGADWGMSTNLNKVFDMILQVGVKNHLPQEEMPKRLYIVSDMEFDMASSGHTNFEAIKKAYEEAGYELPVLVFWNANARNNTIPVTKNDNAILVSGSSPSVFSLAMSDDIDPVSFMKETVSGYKDYVCGKLSSIYTK